MSVGTAKRWITGAEIAQERRRIIDAGYGEELAQMENLVTRVKKRDDCLWSTYAEPLIDAHRDQWAAVSIDGTVCIRPTASAVMAEGTRKFGAGNFACGKLSEIRGRYLR